MTDKCFFHGGSCISTVSQSHILLTSYNTFRSQLVCVYPLMGIDLETQAGVFVKVVP